jgi:hypothetical protein
VSWKRKLSLPIINVLAGPALETAEALNRDHYNTGMEEKPYISVDL